MAIPGDDDGCISRRLTCDGLVMTEKVHGWMVTLVLLGVVTQVGKGFVQLRPPELVVLEGGVAIFTCSPLYSVAIPILVRNGGAVIHKHHPRITFSDHGINTMDGYRTYQLANVTRRENGTKFMCAMGGFFSNTITMTVFVAPRISGPSREIILLEHHPELLKLQYNITGIPHPHSVAWQHNGSPFTGNTRVVVSRIGPNNLSLAVQNPLREDSGNYTVIATSSVGTGSLSVILKIVYNEFIESPNNVTVMTGGVVTMRCVHRFGLAYAWFSNKGPLYRNTDKVQLSASGKTLQYGPVNYTDHLLRVFCVVHVKGNSLLFVSQRGNVSVLFPPFIQSPSSVKTSEGSNIILEFVVHGYPPITSIAFFLNAQPITLNNSRMYALGADRTSLFIGNVSRLDAGNYTIRVRNELGGTSATTQLEVQYSPEIIPLSIPVVGQIHKPVALSCGKSIYGNPKPQLTWTYKSFLHTPLLSDNRFTVDQQTGQLLLSVTKHTDAGDYMCTAVNKIGHYSTCVTLLVLDPPSPPVDVQILFSGSTWFSVTWSPPQNQGSQPVSSYRVRATPQSTNYSSQSNPVSGNQDSTVDQIPPPTLLTGDSVYSIDSACVEVDCETVEVIAGETLINVTGLLPAVEYVIHVVALSNGTNLESEPSSDLSHKTSVSVPGVGSVTAAVHGPGACVVHWTLAYSGGLPVQLFQIQFQRVNDSYWRNVTESASINLSTDLSTVAVPPNVRYWTVHDLESLEEYHFRVRGLNEIGRGQFTSTETPVTSHHLGVPSQPARPAVVSWTENYALVGSSVAKVGAGSTLQVVAMLVLNGVRVSTQTETVYNYSQGMEFIVKYSNISYRGDWQFQMKAANHIGISKPSIISLPARDYNQDIPIVFVTAGPIVGALVGGVNFVVMVTMVILCSVMVKELCRRKKSMARRVEMAQASDCPLSPRSIFFGDLRNSPDGRSNPHIASSEQARGDRERRPDLHLFSFIPTPPTPLSSVSMV